MVLVNYGDLDGGDNGYVVDEVVGDYDFPKITCSSGLRWGARCY